MLCVVSVSLIGALVGNASAGARLDPVFMFVGGGTFVSNGVFFPGTAVYDGEKLQGIPLEVKRGQDIKLTNADEGDIANCHQLASYKRRRGVPVINSKRLCSPGESALILTSRAKPGLYGAFCPVHTGMYALIQINP